MTTIAVTQQGVSVPRVRVRTRLTRRGRIVLAALVVIPLLIGGGVLVASSGAVAGIGAGSSVSFRHVTVQPGDSLWSVAERVAPKTDPRVVVAAIMDLNGMSSTVVQAGEQLAIPHQYDSAR